MYFIVVFIVFHIWKVTKNGLQTKDLSIPRVYIFCSEYLLQFHMCLWVKNDKRGESLQIVLFVVVDFFLDFFLQHQKIILHFHLQLRNYYIYYLWELCLLIYSHVDLKKLKTEDKNDRPTEEVTHGLMTDTYLNEEIFKSIWDY